MSKLNIVLCFALFAVCANAVGVPGAPRPLNAEELADFTKNVTVHLQKLGAKENGPKLGFVKVNSATFKLVAGSLWEGEVELTDNEQPNTCTVSLWEKPWENFVKFNVECGENKKYQWSTSEQRKKRSPQGFGGFGAPSPASAETLTQLKPKLTGAFEKWAKSHPEFHLHLVNVLSGTSQVVAGTVYEVLVEAEENGQTTQWNAKVLENLQGEITQVTLTIPGKQHLLTFN